ncbi:MAG: ferric reductase-like transmembrane domain-containing protein [Alistipes sp.]|nr:ferric reductase-like transmembrane domain-containing protein [Alistipes sp.]
MIKVILDFVQFLLSCAPLVTSTVLFALSGILLAKSIKRHPGVWYTVFAIPFALVAVPTILRWCGIDIGFSFSRVPVLGQIIRDYIHMGTFGHPLLIVIMYMGALDTRRPAVKKLMSIRKELSIISGFPIFTHSLIRVANNFPTSLKYFTDNAGYMENARIGSPLGAGISNFSLVLGILLLVLFIPLWVTSFDRIHRRMGNVRWKKLQKWSYLFYALLFIHAMGIQVGGLMNPRGGQASRPATEAVVAQVQAPQGDNPRAGSHGGEEGADTGRGSRPESHQQPAGAGAVAGETPEERGSVSQSVERGGGRQHNNENRDGEPKVREDGRPHGDETEAAGREARGGGRPEGGEAAVVQSGGEPQAQPQARQSGRRTAKGFTDIQVSSKARGYIQIASLLLIYGSYLYLRVRKARRNAKKKGGRKSITAEILKNKKGRYLKRTGAHLFCMGN